MSYSIPATSKTPALIIYLLNVSASMGHDFGGGKTKIEIVTSALLKVAVRMVQRSTKVTVVSPRYRIAMFAYSSQVTDLLEGIKTIDELAKMGVPQLTALGEDIADTAAAFAEAEKLLNVELPNLQDCPAPLVCHITGSEYNGADPTPIAKRIMAMSVPDGNVLIENIYVKSSGLAVSDINSWPGVSSETQLSDQYSKTLFQMSSLIPESCRSVIREFGYQIAPGARMFFPGDQLELVELAFAMSGVSKSASLMANSEEEPPKSYSVLATSKAPALIIYLLDISRSMNQTLGGRRRIDIVLTALNKVIVRMVLRSTKGTTVAPRYRIAIYGYHGEVVDLLGGIKTVGDVAKIGIPKPTLDYGTQTARAFSAVERLLQLELPHLQDCPAPLVCHMTDGLYRGADPETVVARIKKMAVPDGHVLIENIFISKSVLKKPVDDPQRWTGVVDIEQLGKPYARKLFTMSSAIPASYLKTIREFGYHIQSGARMLFPGNTPDLVELGFAMSGATPVTR